MLRFAELIFQTFDVDLRLFQSGATFPVLLNKAQDDHHEVGNCTDHDTQEDPIHALPPVVLVKGGSCLQQGMSRWHPRFLSLAFEFPTHSQNLVKGA